MKRGGLGIPDPRLSAECACNTSKASSKVLVGSLLGGTDLNYLAHKECVLRASVYWRKQREFSENEALTRRKDLVYGAGLNWLRRATDNGAWITDIPHQINCTEFLWEEFQYNILLRYGIVPLNLPTYCDGCGKRFSVPHDLSCPKGGLVLERHNDDAKEWGTLSDRALNSSLISYKPKINSRTVYGEMNGAVAWVATVGQDGGGLKMERVQRDKQRCLMSHGRIYLSISSGRGAPPLFFTCKLST